MPIRGQIRSAQKVGDAVRVVGAPGIECSFPHCDLAVAHDPDFNAEAAHGGARLGVLPFTFPDVGDGVVYHRPEAFLEAVALLLAAARGEEGAQHRYLKEAHRLYSVLDRRLAQHEFVADDYSIADIAIWPWVSRYEWQTVDLNAYANVKRWYTVIAGRPAVQRGYKVPKDVGEIPMP